MANAKRRHPPGGLYETIELPQIADQRGCLGFIEGGRHVPFDIARVFYLYDVPAAATRAGHAHHRVRELIIAASGGFEVRLDDGLEKTSTHLDRPDRGLLLRPMVWRTIAGFSRGALCLVLASTPYDELDYIRDYDVFLRCCREHREPA